MELAADPDGTARALRLSDRQRAAAVADNAAIFTSPTMPAIDRYTGVLFDALDAGSLDAAARAWLGGSAFVHTAPFGPVRALDAIPAYRLSAGAALPGLPPLKRVWAAAATEALGAAVSALVIDLRSEAYVALGAVPLSVASTYIRVVADSAGGTSRALNHFNKKAKGLFARRMAIERPQIGTVDDLIAWGEASGLLLRQGARAGETELVVDA